MHNMKRNWNAQHITLIGLMVAMTIVLGALILQISRLFVMPGIKYAMMAPMYSMMMYVLIAKLPKRGVALAFNGVFAGIMSFINLYMGLAILLCGLILELSLFAIIKKPLSKYVAGIVYPMLVSATALLVSKYLIGGGFETITLGWIGYLMLLSGLLAMPGILLARLLSKYMK